MLTVAECRRKLSKGRLSGNILRNNGGALGAVTSQASILVVDDDAKSLMAMRELLQSPGLRVVVANSGQQALECALREDFAVVLMDARMPIVDGFETARRMREHERARHTPIIFLTGAYEDPPSMFRGYEAGAVDYIVKPPVPEILRSKIGVFVELYNKSADLRALAARVQSVQEEEQRRIAREIHDELGQALTALKMDLSWLMGRLPPESAQLLEKTRSMSAQIDSMVHSVRELAARLRPEVLDELGLPAAIKWQAREFQLRAGIRCDVTLPVEEFALDQERATALFRIFQELLTNVIRHAAATKVEVVLRYAEGSLLLEVIDDGSGIVETAIRSPSSLGLLGMRERAAPFGGRLEISPRRGRGTSVRVLIPVPAPAAEAASQAAS
jgi:signal transduction histidine kinase